MKQHRSFKGWNKPSRPALTLGLHVGSAPISQWVLGSYPSIKLYRPRNPEPKEGYRKINTNHSKFAVNTYGSFLSVLDFFDAGIWNTFQRKAPGHSSTSPGCLTSELPNSKSLVMSGRSNCDQQNCEFKPPTVERKKWEQALELVDLVDHCHFQLRLQPVTPHSNQTQQQLQSNMSFSWKLEVGKSRKKSNASSRS